MTPTSKDTPESGYAVPPPNLFGVDFALRLLLLASAVSALVVLVMAGVMASATGTAGSVAYLGLKGNSHVNWNKVCNVYDKFCRHVGSSAALSLVASAVLVSLVVLSSYSLYRRCR
ncbi:hypothetical protein B296_00051521 [Ensete ventricosum]|uniref:CASP-like protein n=1 Tax=Ensete ventricosum TaxID=4639 RepID=A0A426YGC3_ENSVE|nr:hypothetical protein B296_00051521 [Ensete ventricosum]